MYKKKPHSVLVFKEYPFPFPLKIVMRVKCDDIFFKNCKSHMLIETLCITNV